jgi:His-Xaa-Ser repeat protein HxsA
MKAKLTLAAMLPGFLSLSSSAETTLTHIEITEENMGGLVLAPLNVNTPLYIAGHRSHSSHGSHGSHRSSAGSSSGYTPPKKKAPISNYDTLGQPSVPKYVAPANTVINLKALSKTARILLIKRVQIAMFLLGKYDGVIDGVMGPSTRKALVNYRYSKGLGSSDVIDANVLNSLGVPAP